MAGIVIFVVIGALLGLVIGVLQAFLLGTAVVKSGKLAHKIIIYIIKLVLWAVPMVLAAAFWGIWSAVAFALCAGPVFMILSLIMYKKQKK